jgi:hypothetical protein
VLGVWTQDLGPVHDSRGSPLHGASHSRNGEHVIQWQVIHSDSDSEIPTTEPHQSPDRWEFNLYFSILGW